MNLGTLKTLLCSAVAFLCASATNAQCVDQWHNPDWNVTVGGMQRPVNGLFVQAAEALWGFVQVDNVKIVANPGGGSGSIFPSTHTSGTTFLAFQVVRWDGRAWVLVPNSRVFGLQGSIGNIEHAVELDEGLFVAGSFEYVEVSDGLGGTLATRSRSIARFGVSDLAWDACWSSAHQGVFVAGGDQSQVSDMLVHDGVLYLVGWFTHHLASTDPLLVRNVAMGVTSWDPVIWNRQPEDVGCPTPLEDDASPAGTGWKQVNVGRNFGGAGIGAVDWQLEFFPYGGVDILHVVGPDTAFITTTATAPADVTNDPNTRAVVRLLAGSPVGYWEAVPGVFEDVSGFCETSSGTVLRKVSLDGEDFLLGRMLEENQLAGSCLTGAIGAWDGSSWNQSNQPVNARRPGAQSGGTPRILEIIVRDSEVSPGQVFVSGNFPRGAQAGAADVGADVDSIFGVNPDGERFDMTAPGGSINGFTLGGVGAAPRVSQGFGRVFVSAPTGTTVRTNAAGTARTAAYWGSPLRCDGDTNGDFMVDFVDLNAVLGAWGTTGTGLHADFNDDGVVDATDLNTVLSSDGSSCCQ